MERVAFVMRIKEGAHDEYKKRHDNIWPEMVQAIRECGAKNYSIFFDVDKVRLFAYLEAEPDFKTFAEKITVHPVNKKWQEWMADLMDTEIDLKTNWPPLLEEAFHMD